MAFDFGVVAGKTVDRLVNANLGECVRIIDEAYRAHGRGQSVNPNSYFLRFPEKPSARIIALPAYLGGQTNSAGIKWIASYPDNVKRGFPRASAVLILNDYETGYPFACLESSIISAARTAASAVLAAERLVGARRAARVGIVGTGIIAKYVHRFLAGMGWEIEELQLFDLRREDAERFAARVEPGRHARVGVAASAEALVSACELSVLTTTAAAPYLTAPELLRHKPVVLNISLRDLSPEIILASRNVVDDVGHVMNANTSVHLTEQRVGHRDFVDATLAQVLEGERQVPRDRAIVFSPFGLGILDLALGKWVYDRAREAGEVLLVPDFFSELQR